MSDPGKHVLQYAHPGTSALSRERFLAARLSQIFYVLLAATILFAVFLIAIFFDRPKLSAVLPFSVVGMVPGIGCFFQYWMIFRRSTVATVVVIVLASAFTLACCASTVVLVAQGFGLRAPEAFAWAIFLALCAFTGFSNVRWAIPWFSVLQSRAVRSKLAE